MLLHDLFSANFEDRVGGAGNMMFILPEIKALEIYLEQLEECLFICLIYTYV